MNKFFTWLHLFFAILLISLAIPQAIVENWFWVGWNIVFGLLNAFIFWTKIK